MKKLTGLLLLVALASSLNADKIHQCLYYFDTYYKKYHNMLEIKVDIYNETKIYNAAKECLDYNLKAEEFCNDIGNERVSNKVSNVLKKDRVLLINMINDLGGF